MTSKMLLFIIALLVAIIVTGGIWWKISSAEHRNDLIQANNELASLFPLKRINDSLSTKVVSINNDLMQSVAKSSQLRKAIEAKDQKILTLISAKMEIKTDTVRIPVRYRDGVVSYFDTTDTWMTIQGFFDSSSVTIATIAGRDSITVAITQAKNDILYGYVQNHSPYTLIHNADFQIDASQFIDKLSPYWKYAAIGGWTAILIKLGIYFLK
jgi:hypothetical protein